MKAILVLFDSLNRHMLGPYGGDQIHAPNFKRLQQHAITFDTCYASSLPCMPARREIHTGRMNFLHRSWSPLEPFDDSMPELLRLNGIYTHLVTDHYHYFENGGATYHTRYNTWEFVRGQEGDPWKGEVKDPDIPPTVGGRTNCLWRQDWVNRKYMEGEENHPQTMTFDKGLEFIQTNRDQDNWFLQIEAFDPHEPFFAPEKYRDMYQDGYVGPHFDWPNYVKVKETPTQVEHVKKEYRALVSLCDHSLGRVLDMMDKLDLWQDTMLIVATDHGFLLGEHDWWAKCVMPFYNEIAHTPFFVWDPRNKVEGERRRALVQTLDIAPTVLEYFHVAVPKDMEGKPLGPVIAEDRPIREAGLFGIHGGHVNCTDGKYVYMRASKTKENTPLNNYTLMPMHMRERFSEKELQNTELVVPFDFTKGCPVLKVPSYGIPELEFSPYNFGTMLFDVEHDPKQEHPIHDPVIEERMIRLMVDLMKHNDCPKEQFERLGLEQYL
jgi:arylsulfatase A-like enzyme